MPRLSTGHPSQTIPMYPRISKGLGQLLSRLLVLLILLSAEGAWAKGEWQIRFDSKKLGAP